MTAYEKELLGLAVEACSLRGCDLRVLPEIEGTVYSHRFYVGRGGFQDRDERGFPGATLADALSALLRDLGVEVPERPSAGLVSALETALFDLMENIPADEVLTFLRRRFGEDPALVLALLEGGAA